MRRREELDKMAKILGGIVVLGSLPDTPAHHAGICYGDILLAVNGVETTTIEKFVEARKLRSDAAEVVLFRNGATLRFDLQFKD